MPDARDREVDDLKRQLAKATIRAERAEALIDIQKNHPGLRPTCGREARCAMLATGGGEADLNGDGKPDLAVMNRGAGSVSVLLNNANGTFAARVDYAAGANPGSVAVSDLNGDGKSDLAVTDSGDNTVRMLLDSCLA